VETLAGKISAFLPGLRDVDDGAIESDGRFVFISSLREQPRPGGLNCSGFVKWVIDGFVYPLLGRNTSVAEAKRVDEGSRGSSLSQSLASLDPYFGLNWTRNLAGMLDQAQRPDHRRQGVGAFDVTSTESVPYIQDVGYPTDQLSLLMYRLAMDHPGEFYLGSVNDATGPGGLRQHFHTLVLLPYFDGTGSFRVRVFERIRETDLGGLATRYPAAHVHLVRVRAEGVFSPLSVP
jgi:hypothetical protein